MATTKMIAPSGIQAGGTIQTEWGNATIDANGFVTVDSRAVPGLERAGFKVAAPNLSSQTIGANGLVTGQKDLLAGFNSDGSVIAAAASAGKFGISLTPGTSFFLISETANSNTKTDKALWEHIVGSGYTAGQDLVVTVNSHIAGAGTPGTKTIDVEVYRQATDGSQGADLCATNAQAITTTAADYAFAITGTTLNPGDKLLVIVTLALQETAASNLNGRVNSVRVG